MRTLKISPSFLYAILLDSFGIALLLALIYFSLQYNTFIFFEPFYKSVFIFTITQALIGATISLIFALCITLTLRKMRGTFLGSLLIKISSLPFLMPSIVGCISLTMVFGQNGIINDMAEFLGVKYTSFLYGICGIVLCHVFYYTPFAMRILERAFSFIQPEYERLGIQLGLSRRKRFLLIEFPLIYKEFFSAFGLVFMYCLRSFTTVLVLGGGIKSNTLEVAIFQAIHFDGDLSTAAQLSLAQFLIVFVMVLAVNRMNISYEKVAPSSRKRTIMPKINLLDIAMIFMTICLFIVPLLCLLVKGLTHEMFMILVSKEFGHAMGLSLVLGIVTAILSITSALFLIHAGLHVYDFNKFRKLAGLLVEFAGNTSSIFSPIVLSAGIYFMLIDTRKDALLDFFVIVFLNSLLFLPNTFRILRGPIKDVHVRYKKLCDSLNLKGFRKWKSVLWPLLQKPIGYAFLTGLVFSIGDTKTILFFNPSFQNLTVLLYEKIRTHNFKQATAIASILIIFSLGLSLIIKNIFRKSN